MNYELDEPNYQQRRGTAKNLAWLMEQLQTQDNCGTQTPLYCVHERESAVAPKDGSGRMEGMFLTEANAKAVMKACAHRLRHPYIWVRGPGEDSELHWLIFAFATGKLVLRDLPSRPIEPVNQELRNSGKYGDAVGTCPSRRG